MRRGLARSIPQARLALPAASSDASRSVSCGAMWLALCLAMALGVGCLGRSPDPRLFTMGSQSRATTSSLDSGVAVLVGPARFPRHLERPQLTRRLRGGEISIDEFNRWAGGFSDNVLRSLAADLALRLDSERVVAYPSTPPFELDYRIRLHFDEFVVGPEAVLQLRVRWAVIDVEGSRSSVIGRTDLDLPLDGEGMLPIVAAHDAAVRALGTALAERIGISEARVVPDSVGLPIDADAAQRDGSNRTP